MKDEFKPLVERLEKIEVLAKGIRELLLNSEMGAAECANAGYMMGAMAVTVEKLSLDMIAVSHDLYNPIPGKKLS